MHHPMNPQMRKCIDACQRCHNMCVLALVQQTLDKENQGKAMQPALVRILIDCSDMCSMANSSLLRGSHFHDRVCQLCAMVCKTCAQECEKTGGMADCLHACLRCAEHCDQLVEAMVVNTG